MPFDVHHIVLPPNTPETRYIVPATQVNSQ